MGSLFVIVGPSAVGKNAILDILRKGPYHHRVVELVSATTRPPRCGERDGVDYRFVTRDEFAALDREGLLAEWVEFEGNLYGTPIDLLRGQPDAATRHVAIVDTVGARAIKAKLGDGATTVFIMPPSEDALRQRFEKRSAYDGEDIGKRMTRARRDMASAGDFDHLVVNDDLETAAAEVAGIMGMDG